ncbi:hypothetical protein [Paracoccus mutanolyticus]
MSAFYGAGLFGQFLAVDNLKALLTAEGVMRAARAAGEKPPSSTTRTNTSISPDRLTSSRAMMSSSHK